MVCSCLPKKYRIGLFLVFCILFSIIIFGYMTFFSEEYRPDFGDPLIVSLLIAAFVLLFILLLLSLLFTFWEYSKIEITAEGLVRKQRLKKDRLIPWSEIYCGRITLTCYALIYRRPLPILQFVLDEKTEVRGLKRDKRSRIPYHSDVWFNAQHSRSIVIFENSKEAEALVRRYFPQLQEDDFFKKEKGTMIWPLQ